MKKPFGLLTVAAFAAATEAALPAGCAHAGAELKQASTTKLKNRLMYIR